MPKVKDPNNNPYLYQAIAILIGGILFYFIMKYIILWVPTLANFLEHVQTPLKESYTWRIIGIICAIIIALALYKIKGKFIIIFGLIEVFGGCWTIWSTFARSFENNILYALAIAAGIFLLVNGLENIMKYQK